MPDDNDQPAPQPEVLYERRAYPPLDPAKVRNWVLLIVLCTGIFWSVIEWGFGYLTKPTSLRLEAVEQYIEDEGNLPAQFQQFQTEQQQAWDHLRVQMELKDSAETMRREVDQLDAEQMKAMLCHIDPTAPGCGG